MAAFNAIKAGDVLYEVSRRKMGNTNMSCTDSHKHTVEEVDTVGHRVRCGTRWYSASRVRQWRRSPARCDDPFKSAEERAIIDARNGLKPAKARAR